MKKITLSLLIVFAVIAVQAQGKFSLGLKAGANFANQALSSSGVSLDTKNKVGIVGGAWLGLFFTEKVAVQPELLFSDKGSTYTISGLGDIKNNFKYLDIPVLLRYQVAKVFNIHAGPQFSALLNAESDLNGTVQDVKDQVKGSDVSLAFGAGLNLPFKLNVTLRYIIGLSNISDQASANATWKNRTLQATLGYRIVGE